MEFEELQAHVMRRSDSPLFARLASVSLEQGDIAYAKELCSSGIQQYPAYTTGYLFLAKCYAVESDYARALETIKKARKLFPDSELLIQCQREWEDAFRDTPQPPAGDREEVVEQQIPADGEIVSQTLAEIYVKQGLIEQAIESYQKLKERKPAQCNEFEKRISELELMLKEK